MIPTVDHSMYNSYLHVCRQNGEQPVPLKDYGARHIVTRSLGSAKHSPEVRVIPTPRSIMLTSDGVHDVIDYAPEDDPEQFACE